MLLNGAAQIAQIEETADNNSRKLRLRCGCQFSWCAFALRNVALVKLIIYPWYVQLTAMYSVIGGMLLAIVLPSTDRLAYMRVLEMRRSSN
jgi:hypothetical protein